VAAQPRLAHHPDPAWIEWFSEIDGISGLCIAAATAFPLLSEAYSRFRTCVPYLRLSALWRSLTGAVPDMVLKPLPAGGRAAAIPVVPKGYRDPGRDADPAQLRRP